MVDKTLHKNHLKIEYRHNIAEILLDVALNTITLKIEPYKPH
jgi:hypothetical protein